jgi:predicted transglutaminase-like cysteine proteinase
VDVWTINAREGDCDAFAIEKRKELLDIGWPSSALSLTVAYHHGEAHLLLTVRTDRGELVLDNLRSAVIGVKDTSYRYVMRQSSIHPQLWVSIASVAVEASTLAMQASLTR